tara:strand:- start:41 stop:196 length:156 start_codon:yes stop_codon:yes gene_type:complete
MQQKIIKIMHRNHINKFFILDFAQQKYKFLIVDLHTIGSFMILLYGFLFSV